MTVWLKLRRQDKGVWLGNALLPAPQPTPPSLSLKIISVISLRRIGNIFFLVSRQQRRHLSSLFSLGKPWQPGSVNYTNLFWALKDKPKFSKFLQTPFSSRSLSRMSGIIIPVEGPRTPDHVFGQTLVSETLLRYRIPCTVDPVPVFVAQPHGWGQVTGIWLWAHTHSQCPSERSQDS